MGLKGFTGEKEYAVFSSNFPLNPQAFFVDPVIKAIAQGGDIVNAIQEDLVMVFAIISSTNTVGVSIPGDGVKMKKYPR